MNESNVGGKFDELAGKAKQGVGEAFGNENLANEGAAQEVKGNAKETWGNVKDTASELGHSAGTTTNTGSVDTETRTANTGSGIRHDVTNAAEHAKDSINRGLDNLKSK